MELNDIKIDIRKFNTWFKDRFPNKDFISIEEMLGDYEELIFENEELKKDNDENYEPDPYDAWIDRKMEEEFR